MFSSSKSPSKSFDPDRDVPDLSGRIMLITGGTTGLGHNSLLQLARHQPKAIYFTGRNSKSAEDIIKQSEAAAPNVAIRFLQCDFTDLSSVRIAAQQFLASNDRLDILMANAGIMAVPAATTKDGFEIQFGTNHLAHALLIKLLLPAMQATAAQGLDTRIVISTSRAYMVNATMIKEGIAFDKLKTDGSNMGLGADWLCYGQSKLANVLYAVQLAQRFPEIRVAVIHPGVVNTTLVSELPFLKKLLVRVTNPRGLMTPEQGAHNQVWAATMPDVKTGTYYEPVGVLGARTELSKDSKLQQRLWDWTEEELKPFVG